MKLIDITSKEEYAQIKLLSVLYHEDDDQVVFVFAYPEGASPSAELKNSLKKEIAEIMKGLCKFKFKFKQSYIDSQVLFDDLMELTQLKFPFLKSSVKPKDLNFEKNNGELNITLELDNVSAGFAGENEFCAEFEKLLRGKYFEKVEVKLLANGELEVEDEPESQQTSDLYNIFSQETKLNVVEVDEVINLVGKLITQDAQLINTIKKNSEDIVVLAGKMTNPVMSQYVPKSQKNSDEPKMRDKFSFTLEDASGSIEVVMFPSGKTSEKLAQLTPDSEVLIEGKVSQFNGNINITANALSLCKVLTKEVQYLWREPISEYRTVNPKPMVEFQQMDLFSEVSEKSSYWEERKSVVVFDFETTGLDASCCEIIEIGAVKVEDGVCVESFSTLINPEKHLPTEITQITGITDDMLVFAPTLEQVLPDFHKFVQGSVLSAYNIGFDIKFLEKAGQKFRYKFDNEKIDTLELARKNIASLHNYKLSSVVKALDITLNDAHRALNDAIATAKVFIKLIKKEDIPQNLFKKSM